MNSGKLVSGIAALAIYLSLIFLVLYFYNIHQTKAKNYVEKNADRVTVTLVNSEKTVFNKNDKVSTPKKPVTPIIPPIPLKTQPKKVPPKKVIPQKPVPKKITPPKKTTPPKKVIPKKVEPKKVIPKKITPPKKVVPKKKVPKKIPPPKKKIPPKKVEPKKVVPKKKVPKKSAKDLFSSVKTKAPQKTPVKNRPKPVVKQPSSIKHNSSITDRIKASHQSGRVSNANRDKGIENAYIAKVKRHMMNWNAVGAKGQWVTVHLTIYNSGKFRYTASGVSGSMKSSLKQYLDTLNRMGLGRHKKSTPYSIQVRFKVR
ncbi:MAG: M-like protein [uncultured Sulfurovum sp.]|uniref:M-like protein n=1 Tax=uncultured Sulfurovum sp. TaxID=269237 RepID=A0A6S6S367_9BACT|nr:MAG: M-like protein [uncultured Sulfurovum sp.]